MIHSQKFLRISTIIAIFATAMITFQVNFGSVMAQNETTTDNSTQGNGTGQEFMEVTDIPVGNQSTEDISVNGTGEVGMLNNTGADSQTEGNATEAVPAGEVGSEVSELPIMQ